MNGTTSIQLRSEGRSRFWSNGNCTCWIAPALGAPMRLAKARMSVATALSVRTEVEANEIIIDAIDAGHCSPT